MRTRERIRVPARIDTPSLPDRNDTRHGEVLLTRFAIGAIGLYALAALVLLPEGNPSTIARLLLGILIPSAAVIALLVLRAGPAWARGALSLVIGFAMMAVTGGVVAKRLADGVSLVDAFGGIAGLAGAVLVVQGWKRTLRRIPRPWARIATAVLSTLLVAQFILLPAGVALDVTNRPRPTGSERTPADMGLRFEDVRISSPDGTILSAWWVPSRNGAAIVLLPGSGSTRHAVLDHAALVARHGYGALLLDWRGHGRSAGRSMEFGWGADRDVTAAISFVLDQRSVTQGIGILGLSMGGEVGLTVAALDHRVGAVVVEGASARTWADAQLEPDPHPVGYVNAWLTFALVGILAPEQPPEALIDLMPRIDASVLMISGSPSNERKLNPIYADAARDTIALWALPDTQHTQALRTHPAGYEHRVLTFFERELLRNDG
jgi:pimeloyl-ACP methyl ester carboxylesterase